MTRSVFEVRWVTDALDHAEGLNFGPDGACYAGGEDGQVYRIGGDGSVETYATVEGSIGGVCLDGDGNLYACNYGTRRVDRITPAGTATVWSTGHEESPAIEPNYPVFDVDGILYYSDSGSYYAPSGRLFAVGPDRQTRLAFGGHLHYANGLAVDGEGQFLYLVESTAADVIRLRILGGGRVGEPELYVSLPGVVPDGLAFAGSGNLYVACYSPDVMLCVSPTRSVEVVIEDPGSEVLNRPTNMAFEPGTTNLWFVNFGGHSIGALDVGEPGAALHLPRIGGT